MIRIADIHDIRLYPGFRSGETIAYLGTQEDLEANRTLEPLLEQGGHTPMRFPALIVSKGALDAFSHRLDLWAMEGCVGPHPSPYDEVTSTSAHIHDGEQSPYRALLVGGEVGRTEMVVSGLCTGDCQACMKAAELELEAVSAIGIFDTKDGEIQELRNRVDSLERKSNDGYPIYPSRTSRP